MTDHEQDRLRDLLTEAVADVEPAHALDEIRARTRGRRRWPYAAGGAVLAVAASFAAFAVVGPDTTPRATDPVDSPRATTSATETPSAPVAVYYVGDTPDGPRLYREFRSVPADDRLVSALTLVFTGTPLDTDYRTGWPPVRGTFIGAEVVDDVIRVEIGDPELLIEHDPPTAENAMAIEQVIYTAQAAVQERLPVQFVHDGNPVSEVLGRPTSEPLASGPILDTLAHVSLTTPADGMVVDNDDPLDVEGVGNSYDGLITTWVDDSDGVLIDMQHTAIDGKTERGARSEALPRADELFPFEVTFDLTGIPTGDYVVISQNSDPVSSGDLQSHTDTRRITVVD